VPIEGRTKIFEVDTVVIATGQGPNPLLTADVPELKRDARKGTIIVDEKTMQSVTWPDVFAGGDIVTGGATVILAMGAGRMAANAMHSYLMTGTV
jgi:glutamate synthase (NADPH/NADH) small chain